MIKKSAKSIKKKNLYFLNFHMSSLISNTKGNMNSVRFRIPNLKTFLHIEQSVKELHLVETLHHVSNLVIQAVK